MKKYLITTLALSLVFSTPLLAEAVPSGDDGYASQTVSNDSIAIDGNLNDWSTLNSFGYDSDTLQDEGIKADIVEGWIAHDNNNLYVAYQNTVDLDLSTRWAWQVYFDTDETAATGFSIEEDVGAEYMLQGSGVFKYTGTGSDWSWQYVTAATNAYLETNAEFMIPRLALGFPEKLKVVFKTRNAPFTGSYAKSGIDTYPKPFEPVELHRGVLLSQPAIWNESGGEVAMTLAAPAAVGDTQLTTTENHPLLNNQLLTYVAEDGEYYTTQLASVDEKTITLAQPLEKAIAAGQNLWNFYNDGSHPNRFGYRAVVDFTLRNLGVDRLDTGNHLLLGDSWFDGNGSSFEERLAEKLPNATIVNRALGGSTSSNVLSSFDANVTNQNPDFVWVSVGINDATSDVLPADYLNNMQILLGKIRAIGAQPIIHDSQVATLFFGSEARTELTRSYAAGLPDIDSTLRYKLTETVLPPEGESISNNKTIVIDGDLADWDGLQSFGEDADDITEADAKADFLEAWMAHDDDSLYVAYRNDGEIDTQLFWPWQIYLDTDNTQNTGYQIGNEVGANFLIQGGALFSYIGTGYDWSWQYVEGADVQANIDVVELKLPRQALGNPESMSIVLKARNGIFTNNFAVSGVDSYPDLDQGHFDYQFNDSEEPNLPPDAVEDSLPSEINLPEFEIDVLANDTDPNNDILIVESVEPARSGSVRLLDGKVLYTPPSAVASDTFRYTISDGRGGTASASVTIGVRDPNDPNLNNPVVVDEFITVIPGETVIIKVLENDSDADGDILSLDQVSQGSQGGVTKKVADENGDLNWIEYTSLETATGTEVFWYGVPDGRGGNGSGKVTVTFELPIN